MSVADKYMQETTNKNFRFIPPEFNVDLFKNDGFRRNESNSNLFPSETEQGQLYCYYNALNGCNNKINSARSYEEKYQEGIMVKIPSPTELLRKYNYELDGDNERGEIEDIYNKIMKNHNNIVKSLTEYKIPVPIANLIMKKIVRISLKYSKECNKA